MRKIPVYLNDTLVAWTLVDDEDYDTFAQFTWHLSPKGYVTRSSTVAGKEKRIQLHQAVMGWLKGSGVEVDHINRDKLDNRKNQLRLVTRSVNQHNRGLQVNNRSGVKGVCWDSERKMWRAQIYVMGKQYRLGRYDTIEEAEIALREFRENKGLTWIRQG